MFAIVAETFFFMSHICVMNSAAYCVVLSGRPVGWIPLIFGKVIYI